jgi:hypothetical protein
MSSPCCVYHNSLCIPGFHWLIRQHSHAFQCNLSEWRTSSIVLNEEHLHEFGCICSHTYYCVQQTLYASLEIIGWSASLQPSHILLYYMTNIYSGVVSMNRCHSEVFILLDTFVFRNNCKHSLRTLAGPSALTHPAQSYIMFIVV